MSSIIHRGPDSAGRIDRPPYHGGIRRLSINDVEHGDQPLFNTSRTVSVVYNGEIYNSPALRTDMEARGFVFQTHSDGEVICHLYDLYGEEAFEHLDGMYAISLWDEAAQRLILARDHAGEKPLYYARLEGGGIVFGSEIRALKIFPGLKLELNRQALWDFPTFGWIPEPETIFTAVKALERGQRLVFEKNEVTLRAIRNTFTAGEGMITDDDEAIRATRAIVEDAVRARLLSDVEVGTFLSGGLDSSIVTSIAAASIPDLMTFCVGFEDVHDPHHGSADESVYAQAFADHIGCRHHLVRATPEFFRGHLDNFVKYGDQPFAISSGMGIYAVSHAAREMGIKVLLSGDGADECFGGYSWYVHLAEALGNQDVLPPGDEKGIISYNNTGIAENERVRQVSRLRDAEKAWAWHYFAHESEKARLYSHDFAAEHLDSVRFFERFRGDGAWQPVDFIRHDRAFYQPFEMMRKLDLMTMANSVEGRAPFVAPSILAHVERLGFTHLVRGKTLKWALREAFRNALPMDIIERPKHGFNVPLDHWFRSGWRELLKETFSSDSALARAGLIDTNGLVEAVALSDNTHRVSGQTLFAYVILNMWLEQVWL